MKKQLVIIGIVALLITVGLSGCTNNPFDYEKNRFVGTWTQQGVLIPETHTFFSDGTCSVGVVSGTYDIKDGKLVETLANGQMTVTWTYSFSNDDTILTLTQVGTSFTLILHKQ